MFGVIWKKGCHSNVTLVSCRVGVPLHVCTVDTASWSLPPFWRRVATHGWASGIRSPSCDLWTSRSTRSGWSHCDSACSDSGLRVPCLNRYVLSSMARFFSSMPASLLTPLFRSVQEQRTWPCFEHRPAETYRLQLHCITNLITVLETASQGFAPISVNFMYKSAVLLC